MPQQLIRYNRTGVKQINYLSQLYTCRHTPEEEHITDISYMLFLGNRSNISRTQVHMSDTYHLYILSPDDFRFI